MAFRAAKNDNGVIICIGNDQGDSGNYPVGSSDETRMGVFCTWTFEEIPEVTNIDGAQEHAMRFKENEAGDNIELRADADVLASPNG